MPGEPSPRAVLFALARRQRRPLLLGALAVGGATVLHVVVPALLGSVVDAALGARSFAALDRRALLLVGFVSCQCALTAVGGVLLRGAAERMIVDLRARLLAHLLRLPLPFHQQAQTGELLSASASDLGVLQEVLASAPAQVIATPFVLVGSLGLMLSASVRLTLLILAAAPLMALAVRAFGNRLRRLSGEVQSALGAANGALQETLAGIETVQAYANEALHQRRYVEALRRAYRHQWRHIATDAAFGGVMTLAGFAAFLAAFWAGGRMVMRHELSSGALVALLGYAVYLQGGVGAVTQIVGSTQTALGALGRVQALFGVAPATDAPPRAPLRLDGDLRFEEVRFRHAGQARDAVDGVTLTVPRGTTCALVGPSGAGKTTLARLLYRFYQPQAGRILIGDVDIASVPLAELRRSLAYVAQDPVLFTGTIGDNIRYGRLDATEAEVREAARAAYADEFIRALPDGYDTRVGERGVTLSGGQRQRIAIARALLAAPKVLVLDEATSALDGESERCVQLALERLRHGRTTLVIAHRATTIARADAVARLEDGRLVQHRARGGDDGVAADAHREAQHHAGAVR